MKIIYNNALPPKGFVAINLFGVIFARQSYAPLTKKTINHEQIHTAQMKSLLYVFFYLWYGVEWLIRFAKYKNAKTAYYHVSFEKEAYSNDLNFDYLKTRKPFAWIKYL